MLLDKKIKQCLAAIAFCTVGLQSFAAQDVPINVTMSELGETIGLLSTEIFSEDNETPVQAEEFKKRVLKLAEEFKASKSHIDKRAITYHISYDLMSQYLEDIKSVVNRGDISLAKGMLKSVPYLCVGCHTQDTQQKKIFNTIERDKFENDYQYAEYLFVTRNYEQAVEYYDKYLNTLNPPKDEYIQTALKRILVIYSQIQKKPEKAIKSLEPFLANSNISKSTRANVNEWIKGLKDLKASSVVDEENYQKRQEYVEYYLEQLINHGVNYFATEKDKVFYITLRGLLYEYLNSSPTENDIPVVLYWLAVCDRTLEYSFFDDLADIYLKECILSYPNHPYAKKCFKEYEAFMHFAYTGSQGTQLPSDIAHEIEVLQSVIQRASNKNDKTIEPEIKKPIIN